MTLLQAFEIFSKLGGRGKLPPAFCRLADCQQLGNDQAILERQSFRVRRQFEAWPRHVVRAVGSVPW